MNIIRGLSAISSLFSDLGPIGKAWHSDNHGHNSGLDADTVDSIEGSQIVRNDVDNTVAGNFTISGVFKSDTIEYIRAKRLPNGTDLNDVDGVTIPSGFYDIDGQGAPNSPSANYIYLEVNRNNVGNNYCKQVATVLNNASAHQWIRIQVNGTWTPWYDIWNGNNQGHLSGLDADTVDSIEGSQIVRNDVDNTIAGNNVFQGNIDCTSLPTTDPGIPGRLWNNSGTLQISL